MFDRIFSEFSKNFTIFSKANNTAVLKVGFESGEAPEATQHGTVLPQLSSNRQVFHSIAKEPPSFPTIFQAGNLFSFYHIVSDDDEEWNYELH